MMSLTSCFTTDSCTWSWIQQVRRWRFIEIAGRFATNQKAAIDVVRNYCNRSESTGWEIIVSDWTPGHGWFVSWFWVKVFGIMRLHLVLFTRVLLTRSTHILHWNRFNCWTSVSIRLETRGCFHWSLFCIKSITYAYRIAILHLREYKVWLKS